MPTRKARARTPRESASTPHTPRDMVTLLDRYIVGQHKAKRAVAIALRNRWRRNQVPEPLRSDITPANILMIGPTGVGKTEIARRVASFIGAPFVKVEATRFTEVGYVGRDVEAMVRELVDSAVGLVRRERASQVADRVRRLVLQELYAQLEPEAYAELWTPAGPGIKAPKGAKLTEARRKALDAFAQRALEGEYADRVLELDLPIQSRVSMGDVFVPMGMTDVGQAMQEALDSLVPRRSKRRKLTLEQASDALTKMRTAELIDDDEVVAEALARTEETGVIFIDEIDKIAGPPSKSGPDVSREGVQRDLLPIVEGALVHTKYGPVRTDKVLFIAAGAFHLSKPSDLIPELQGRFPVRVELDPLTADDFVRILTEPENALLRQYTALLAPDGLALEFTADAIRAMADAAYAVNSAGEDIGARRLLTVLSLVLDEHLFESRPGGSKRIVIDATAVHARMQPIRTRDDLSRYIL